MALNNIELIERLGRWKEGASGISEALRQLEQENAEQAAKLKLELTRASAHLCALYLPSFEVTALSRAAQLTGMNVLATEKPFVEQRLDGEKSRQRLSEIARDDRFQNARSLLQPEIGSLARRLSEAQSFLQPWEKTFLLYKHSAVFMRLYLAGYHTPLYPYKWWHPFYYRDWREADELVEAHRKPDWEALVIEYAQAKQEYERWSSAVAQLQAEVETISALVEEHQTLTARLNGMDEVHLALWQNQLGKHLEGLAPEVLYHLTQAESIHAQLALISGLKAKLDYLEALRQHRLVPDRALVDKALAKSTHMLKKTLRAKNMHKQWADHEVRAALPDLASKLSPKWDKYRSMSQTVVEFSAYHTVSLATDFLWWDVMTDGRLDGDFIPEVRQFRQAHPGYSPGAHNEDDADALEDALAATRTPSRDLSDWDAS